MAPAAHGRSIASASRFHGAPWAGQVLRQQVASCGAFAQVRPGGRVVTGRSPPGGQRLGVAVADGAADRRMVDDVAGRRGDVGERAAVHAPRLGAANSRSRGGGLGS